MKANVVFFDAQPKDGTVRTQGVWFYDLRTNKHFTLKTRTLGIDDLRDFIACFNAHNRHQRQAEAERFRYFGYDELVARDKASLDVFWLKDESLDNLADLPPPAVLQQEIIDHLGGSAGRLPGCGGGAAAVGQLRGQGLVDRERKPLDDGFDFGLDHRVSWAVSVVRASTIALRFGMVRFAP